MKPAWGVHAGLLPLYSDRDTQGLTSHVTLCPVCFPDAIKDVEKKKKKKKCTSSEPLAFPAGEIWRACLQICHPPGVWWATRAAVWAPRERRQEGNNCPLIKVPVRTIAELAATRVYRRIWTCQATAPGALTVLRYFKPSNFLFSTPASVGWYEVLASVHQPYQRSSQATKKSDCNSRLVEFMNEFRSSESSVSDLLFLLDAVGLNSVQGEKKRFLCPITGNKSTLPMLSPCYISSICGAQCTPGVPLQGDLIQLFGRPTFSHFFSYISPEGL